MRRLSTLVALVVLGAALMVSAAGAASNENPLPFFTNATLGRPMTSNAATATDTTAFVLGAKVYSGRLVSGLIALRVWCDSSSAAFDTLAVDSIACETFLFADAGVDSSQLAPVDLDDSSPRLDGWFCTTLDSTRLVLPGNLTPITGAASVLSKFPFDVSRRIVFGQATTQAWGVDIPFASLLRSSVRPGYPSPYKISPDRWFFLDLNDAYGGALRGFRTVTIAVLNRQPRIKFRCSAWLMPAVE